MPEGAVNTTYTFASTDVITSTKLNDILDQSVMTGTAIIGNTLEVASGKLKVASQGITSNEMGSNSVTTNAITDLNVTTGKIADLAITTGKIANLGVTTAKIADSNVTTVKIADSNITAPKLDGSQTGLAPIFGVRAWVVFDMTRNASGGSDTLNTNRFIYSSGNVGSVTKINTGEFQVNFATPMPNSNYAYSGAGMDTDSIGDVLIGRANSALKTNSSIKLKCISASASAINFGEVSVMFIG